MPSRPRINYEELAGRFRQHLLKGVSNAADACRFLDISQPTFSRVVSRYKGDFLSVGRASKTQYALRREIPGVGQSVVVHQINEQGKTLKLGSLHGIEPKDEFYFESENPESLPSQFFGGLPYFLNDLRPAGFLGRLIPQKYPKLEVPKDILKWSPNHCLLYLARYGSDLIGNLILGEDAFRSYLESKTSESFVDRDNRSREYPRMASDVLEYGDPGSSAGGEQPKFLAVVGSARNSALVKFSPKVDTEIGRRVGDLLLCEDISLKILKAAGHEAASSEIVEGNNQIFLETARFDRIGPNGRRAMVSLETLDAEFSGRGIGWVERARGLHDEGIIAQKDFVEIRWRELYGRLIANSDMHAANLSFFIEWPQTVRLAPVYDMLPMLYIPKNDQMIDREFSPPLPSPSDSDIWLTAWGAARDFWRTVCDDHRVSREFRLIARDNLKKLNAQEGLGDLLPH